MSTASPITPGEFSAMAASGAMRPASSITGLAIICAPSSLGLRPGENGKEPGAWRGPEVLLRHGLAQRLGATVDAALGHPCYSDKADAGTRIRNGRAIRGFAEDLALRVGSALDFGRFPVVMGGDCSVLLGCLYGAALRGGQGLVHVDGHSDYFHPGNYDVTSRLGSAAGMDLALATGKGEPLLAEWPSVGTLIQPVDAVQVGERDAERPEFAATYGDIARSGISRFTVQAVLSEGIEATANRIVERLSARNFHRAWLHVDFDVLDASVLSAVDSPGTPGLTYAQLSDLLGRLLRSRRFSGLDFTIYDPDLDPGERAAPALVDCVVKALKGGGYIA